jgi:predicted DsbA family dithiol-disulfide isomerase
MDPREAAMKITTVLTLFLAFSTTLSGQTTGKRLAVVNGEVITEEQVQAAARQELESIELKRLQFEAELARGRSSAIENALEAFVTEKLLAAEAKKQNVSRDELVQAEVDAKVPFPSDQVVERFWNENAGRINMTKEQALPQIRLYLRQQDRDRVMSEYLERLKTAYKVESFFEPHRTEVAIDSHPTLGPAQAPITIVEFSDFECPYCGSLFPTLKEIEKRYQDQVRIVYRQFPLTQIHPNAQKAAEASLCAHEQQKFWEFHDAMFTDQRNLSIAALKEKAVQLRLNPEQFNGCLDNGKYVGAVQKDVAEGQKVGLTGTPALFINGRYLNGAQPYEEIAKIIDDELRRRAASAQK